MPLNKETKPSFLKRLIWPIDVTLTSIITPGQSRPGSNGNEVVLYILQISVRCSLEWYRENTFLLSRGALLLYEGDNQHIYLPTGQLIGQKVPIWNLEFVLPEEKLYVRGDIGHCISSVKGNYSSDIVALNKYSNFFRIWTIISIIEKIVIFRYYCIIENLHSPFIRKIWDGFK